MEYSKIDLVNICKYYRQEEKELNILKNININFSVGKIYAIVGKSGSGKTSLLNIIGGIDSNYSGVYRYCGKSINKKNLNYYRNKKISYSTQKPVLFDNLNVSQNINLPLFLENKEIVNDILKNKTLKYNLLIELKEKIKNLSYGQKQRVDFIRNIEISKKVILLDETLSGIDIKTKDIIGNELQKIKNNKIIIIVTHDNNFIKKFVDETIEIKDGKISKNLIKNNNTYIEKISIRRGKLSSRNVIRIAFSFLKANIKRVITYISLLSTAFTGLILIFLLSQTFTNYFNSVIGGDYIKSIYNISLKSDNYNVINNDNSIIIKSDFAINTMISNKKLDISKKINSYRISKELISLNSVSININSDYLNTITNKGEEYINKYLQSNIYNLVFSSDEDKKLYIRLINLKIDNSIKDFEFVNSNDNWNAHVFGAFGDYDVIPCQRFYNNIELNNYVIKNSENFKNLDYEIYDNCLIVNKENINKLKKEDLEYLISKYGKENIVPCSIKQGIYCNELTGEIKFYGDYEGDIYEVNYKIYYKEKEDLKVEISSDLKEFLVDNYFILQGGDYKINVKNFNFISSKNKEIKANKNILSIEKITDNIDTNFVFIYSNHAISEEEYNVANIYNDIKKPIDNVLQIVEYILLIFFLFSVFICLIGLITIEFLDFDDRKKQIGYLQSLGWGNLNIYRIVQFENLIKFIFSSIFILGMLFFSKFNIENIFLNILKEKIIINISGCEILIIICLVFVINYIVVLFPFLKVMKTSPLDNLSG